MTAYLLLAACAAGQYPPPAPPGWPPSYPYAGYAVYRPPMPPPPPTWTHYQPTYQQPTYQVGSYTVTPMPAQGAIVPVGSCAGGDCGAGGCASSGGCCDSCDDGCRKHRLLGRLGHRRDCCELPCGHPDYKQVSNCCKPPRCGLLSRLRECFKRDCCKPSLRDRLKSCFHKDDCCEPAPTCCKPKDDCNPCCRPSLHDRLRAFFHRRKNADCCCSTSAAPPAGAARAHPEAQGGAEGKRAGGGCPVPDGAGSGDQRSALLTTQEDCGLRIAD